MPTITSPDQFSDHKKYVDVLKKVLSHVKVDDPKPFVYFKEYVFADKKKTPCVLVDYSTGCLDDLRKARRLPTASGEVSLTSDGKLKFHAQKGTFKALVVKKYLATIDGVPEVWVDANEVDDSAVPPKPFQLATPTAGSTVNPVAQSTMPARPAQLRPTKAAPARPVDRKPPPTRVTIPLPDSEDDQKQLVKDYAAGLAKAKLPSPKPDKNDVLIKALQLSNAGQHGEAMQLLNGLARDVVYLGVDEWAVQRPLRKYEIELLSEKYHGLLNLIENKRKQPGDWAAERSKIINLLNEIVEFSEGIQKGLLAADPAAVKKAFDCWAPLVQQQHDLAGKLKQLWLADQEARLVREVKKSKSSYNVSLAKSYGKDAILEMAQMAEIQAIRYQNDKKSDPVAQGKWHQKLEIAEMAAIYGYSTADYTAVGQLLRGKTPETEAEKKAFAGSQQKFADYIEAAKKGLAKLPAYQGSGVRCTKSLWEETIAEITKTGGHVEKSFMSVGKQKVSGFGDIEWHFEKIKTGRDITMFSLHQTEGEILFPPGARFKFYRAETTAPDGQKVRFSDPRQFANYVTPATKAGKFWFEEIA